MLSSNALYYNQSAFSFSKSFEAFGQIKFNHTIVVLKANTGSLEFSTYHLEAKPCGKSFPL